MLSRNHPGPHPYRLRRPPPGGQRWPAPSGHPGPTPRPFPIGAGAPRLGDAPGRANTGDKIMTLVASALAGGDCIGRTACALSCVVKAPSASGTFLRNFRWGLFPHLEMLPKL